MNLLTQTKVKVFLRAKSSLPIIAILGLAIVILIVTLQPNPKHQPASSLITAVNYIEVKTHLISPEIVGFGVIKPDVSLQAKAEVSGRVTYMHPKLKKGEIFTKGTLLLTIDDKDYLLQLKQAQADLLVNKANLQEMVLTIENNKLELDLALEKLRVRKTEYARMLKLSVAGAISQSSLNGEKQNLLQQKQEVQQLENQKTILPSTLEVMKAQLDISQAKLETSQRDLARTKINMPFDGRVSEVYTELNEYVAITIGMPDSGLLFDVFSLNKVIINAQFPLEQFRLFAQNFTAQTSDNNENGTSLKKTLQSLGLTAMVEDPSGRFMPWPAKVERFSDNLDAKSRTVGIMVSVSDSYMQVLPGIKPPLLEGMYMKVVLAAKPQDMLVIPRFTLHDKQLFTITENNKLARITIEKPQYYGDLLLIDSKNSNIIKTADKVITSDVFPAVNGMLLSPVLDENVTDKIAYWLRNSAESKQALDTEAGAEL